MNKKFPQQFQSMKDINDAIFKAFSKEREQESEEEDEDDFDDESRSAYAAATGWGNS